MLRWLRRLLRPRPRSAPRIKALRQLPPDGPGAGRRRISTTVEDFEAHLAQRARR